MGGVLRYCSEEALGTRSGRAVAGNVSPPLKSKPVLPVDSVRVPNLWEPRLLFLRAEA